MKRTMLIVFLVSVLAGLVSADSKIPVCVEALQVPIVGEDGFKVEGAEKAQQDLDNSAKDLAKQINKRKTLTTKECSADTLKLVVYFRGRVPDGSFSVNYNDIGKYFRTYEGRTMKVAAMLTFPDGRSKDFQKAYEPGFGMPSWGGLAKGISKDVEKFLKAQQ